MPDPLFGLKVTSTFSKKEGVFLAWGVTSQPSVDQRWGTLSAAIVLVDGCNTELWDIGCFLFSANVHARVMRSYIDA